MIRITRARGARFRARTDRRAGSGARSSRAPSPGTSWHRRRAAGCSSRTAARTRSPSSTATRPRGKRKVIGHVNLTASICNAPDRTRHFQPRGPGRLEGRQAAVRDELLLLGEPGRPAGHRHRQGGRRLPAQRQLEVEADPQLPAPPEDRRRAPGRRASRSTPRGDGAPDPTSAFPNQMQSIVIRGNQAYLPNIAASPSGPLRFNVDDAGVRERARRSAHRNDPRCRARRSSHNLHLGARQPEPGKKKLFFANLWGIGFTKQSGAGTGYAVSSGSDLLVKVNVAADGKLTNTVDADTTRYIDLNDPANPATAGNNAGKFPQGIVMNRAGTRAYVVELRVPQRVGRRSHTGSRRGRDPHRGAARARLDRGDRGRGRRDVLLLARVLQPARGCDCLHLGAPVERGLAGLLELSLRGADRRRSSGPSARGRASRCRSTRPSTRRTGTSSAS